MPNPPKILDYVSEWELEEIRHELMHGEDPAFVAFRHGVPRKLVNRGLAYPKTKEEVSFSGKFKRWDSSSVAYVFENYPIHGQDWEGWKKLGRTWKSIQSKATSLGIGRAQYTCWTKRECDFLKEHYHNHGKNWDGWARLNNRSWNSIVNKAFSLGLCRDKRGRPRKAAGH